jgi:hypothetical protein
MMTLDDAVQQLSDMAENEYPDDRDAVVVIKREIKRLQDRCEWYKLRCDALQQQQRFMRDPERKMVCDILANGKTSVDKINTSLPKVIDDYFNSLPDKFYDSIRAMVNDCAQGDQNS